MRAKCCQQGGKEGANLFPLQITRKKIASRALPQRHPPFCAFNLNMDLFRRSTPVYPVSSTSDIAADSGCRILISAGFVVEGRLPLMVCVAEDLRAAPVPPDIDLLQAESPAHLRDAADVQNLAYSSPATAPPSILSLTATEDLLSPRRTPNRRTRPSARASSDGLRHRKLQVVVRTPEAAQVQRLAHYACRITSLAWVLCAHRHTIPQAAAKARRKHWVSAHARKSLHSSIIPQIPQSGPDVPTPVCPAQARIHPFSR